MRALPCLLLLTLLGCSDMTVTATPDAGVTDMALGPTNPLVAARPYESQVPDDYDPKRPAPLVILLHGYGATGFAQDAYFGLGKFLKGKYVLYALPDGTLDKQGHRFWNATDACCDLNKTGVDDVAYITAIIDDMSTRYSVDKKRIYLTGHSNGGYMSYRMACDRADRIAAIVSLAGANWKDPARCQPKGPVSVLEVHGDMDEAVPYKGDNSSPSAAESVGFWAKQDGCGPTADIGQPLDLERIIPGAETTVQRFPGCKASAVELWTIQGGTHIPALQPTWAETLYGFMDAHPRP